jgi:hypothetical protein
MMINYNMIGKNYKLHSCSMTKPIEEVKFHLRTDVHKRLIDCGCMGGKFIIYNCVLWKIKTNFSTAYRMLTKLFSDGVLV